MNLGEMYMNWIKNLFSSVRSHYGKIFSDRLADGIMHVISTVSPWVVKIYPIVEQIAALTPTRTDDEVLALAKKYALKFSKSTPKDFILREVAKVMLKKEIPEDVVVQDYILNLAVELAYAKFKQEPKES